MAAILTRVGDFCVRRRWLVLGLWLAVLVLAGCSAGGGDPQDFGGGPTGRPSAAPARGSRRNVTTGTPTSSTPSATTVKPWRR